MTTLRAVQPTPLAESLARLEGLVSPYTGLVREVGELLSAPGDTRLIRLACRLANLGVLTGVDVDLRPGGYAAGRELARAAALGEAAERYSACSVPEAEIVLAPASELGREAVAPERFALFRGDQYARPDFPFRRFTSSTPVRWIRGFSLPDGSPAWLPLQLVCLARAGPAAPEEERIGYTTSSGAACAASLEEALLRGLLELVERDAFCLVWYNRLSLPLLDIGREPELVAHARRYFEPAGTRFGGVDLSSFLGVPTVLGVVRGVPPDAGPLGLGAASATTAAEAWRRALAEAFAVHAWVRSVRLSGAEPQYRPDFADIVTFDDHLLFYSTYEHAALTEFLDAGSARVTIADVPPLEGAHALGWLETLCARLEEQGSCAYAVDITSPDIRRAGLHVVKVVAPELCPLDVAYEGRFLGGRRLYEAAFHVGLRAGPLEPDDVNPHPHPFP